MSHIDLEIENTNLRGMLWEYVKAQSRMAQQWADGDDVTKKSLWKNLHKLELPARDLLERKKP